MSLSEIQTLLEKEDIILIEQKLIEKNNQIHQQMRELKAMHEAVERTIQSIERYRKSPAWNLLISDTFYTFPARKTSMTAVWWPMRRPSAPCVEI